MPQQQLKRIIIRLFVIHFIYIHTNTHKNIHNKGTSTRRILRMRFLLIVDLNMQPDLVPATFHSSSNWRKTTHYRIPVEFLGCFVFSLSLSVSLFFCLFLPYFVLLLFTEMVSSLRQRQVIMLMTPQLLYSYLIDAHHRHEKKCSNISSNLAEFVAKHTQSTYFALREIEFWKKFWKIVPELVNCLNWMYFDPSRECDAMASRKSSLVSRWNWTDNLNEL